MIYVIIVLLVIIGFFFLLKAAHKLLTNCVNRDVPLSMLDKYIGVFIRQGYDGSIIMIKQRETGHFVQFVKNLYDDDNIHLEFGFPKAKWSEVYYPHLEEAFRREGIDYDLTPTKTKEIPEFLDVDCGSDCVKATWISRIALIEVMGISEHENVDIHIVGGGSAKEEVIGRL